jgi:hypothetical protein
MVAQLLDGGREVVQLRVRAATQERLPQHSEMLGVGQRGVTQADRGPAHAILLRNPRYDDRLRCDFIR